MDGLVTSRYGGWDSGINSEFQSAPATKPPSVSGHESTRGQECSSVSMASQVYYGQHQLSATPQEMDFNQPHTPMMHRQPQMHMQIVETKNDIAFGTSYLPHPQGLGQQQLTAIPQTTIVEAPFTPSTPQQFIAPRPVPTATSTTANETAEDDSNAQAIFKIIELISDEDPVVVNHASLLIQEMCKTEQKRQLLLGSQAALEAIFNCISTRKELEIVRVLTGALHTLSQNKNGLKAIVQNGGIPSVVLVLSSANCQIDHTTTNYALTILHNALLQESELGNVKQMARKAQGAAVLTRLLSNNNPKFLAILIDCLHTLCVGHSESKLAVVANGGPALLVRILRSHTYEKLLWTVSRLTKVLSTCQQNKTAIIEAGGMHALTAQLSQPSSRLVMNCLWSLRNLSDAATKQTGLDHLMHFLLNILASVRDKDMVSCAIGVLSNLTCNNVHNKIVIVNAQGVEIIFNLVSQPGIDNHLDILEPALFTLRHLTSRHTHYERAQQSFVSLGGIRYLSQILSTPWASIRPPIAKAACGLLRNIALLDSNHQAICEAGCLHRLADILNPAAAELKAAADKGNPAPRSQDGTKLDDLADQAAGALHAMLKDPQMRQLARQLGVSQSLILLSNCPNISESVRKQAQSALTELTALSGPPQAPVPPPSSHPMVNPALQERLQGSVNQQQNPQGSQQVYLPQSVPHPPSSMTPSTTTNQQPQVQSAAQPTSQPGTPKQNRPPQPQPSVQYQKQVQHQQQYQQQAKQITAIPEQLPQQTHSLPQSPYHHPPRIMSTQPQVLHQPQASMSVPQTPHHPMQHQQQPMPAMYHHPTMGMVDQHGMPLPQQYSTVQQQHWYDQQLLNQQSHQMPPQQYQQQMQFMQQQHYVPLPQQYASYQ